MEGTSESVAAVEGDPTGTGSNSPLPQNGSGGTGKIGGIAGYGLVFTGVFLWSTIEVVSKALDGLTQLEVALLRFLLSYPVLVPFVIVGLRRIGWRMPVRDHLKIAGLGILGVTVTFSIYHIALDSLSAHALAIMISSNPLFVALLALPILGERLGGFKMVGIPLGTAGVLLMAFSSDPDIEVLGIVLGLISAVLFALFVVLSKGVSRKYGASIVTPLAIIYGTPFFIPVVIAREGLHVPNTEALTVGTWLAILYLGLVAVGAAYMMYFVGLEKVDTARGSSLFYLKPVIATALAITFLGEDLDLIKVISLLLISLGLGVVMLGNLRAGKARRRQPEPVSNGTGEDETGK